MNPHGSRWIFLCLPTLISAFWDPSAFAQSSARVAPPATDLAVPALTRTNLEAGLARLAVAIEDAARATEANPALTSLLPDVLIFQKAADWALRYDELYSTNDFALAEELIAQGLDRARQLAAGIAPWTELTGLVVRGYRSRIDDSIQPYGLIVPEGWHKGTAQRFRLDVWLHGRDEKLTELRFIQQRRRSRGQFAPADAFVLHPYGRYCNAFKFAGETDVFEAMAAVEQQYPIDAARRTIRGFSMGGAGAWHLAAHHPGIWAAAAPGAGFAETADYLGKLRREPLPPAWEQALWGLYDATACAGNFFNLPVVGYDGSLDKQKQAADVMQAAMLKEGLQLARVTGDNVGHQYTPAAIEDISRRIDGIVRTGKEPVPRKVNLTTRTLRYAQSHWIQIEGLEEHWQPANITAERLPSGEIQLLTANVSALRLSFRAGECPLDPAKPATLRLDHTKLDIPGPSSDRSWEVSFHQDGDVWRTGPLPVAGLRKRPGLQGPIDDAFFDSFLMVTPIDRGGHAAVDVWVERELDWMRTNWRGLFRGQAREKSAADVTEEDIARHHLILWGDPLSNPLLARLLAGLSVKWDHEAIALGGQRFPSDRHVPVLIFPNPLNPEKYVVLNSGFTFRAFGSNVDQTPKLPDYAIVDVTQPASAVAPGAVAAAGFFDEFWRIR